MATFGQRSLTTLKGIHPDLVKVLQEAIKDTPIDFTITDGVRTTEQQKALYAKGRDKNGKIIDRSKIVTNADGVKNKSNHQVKADGYGHAVDLYGYVNGAVDYNDNSNSLPVIAAHILAVAKCLGVKITWGGSWQKLVDKPHFELTK